VREAYEATKDAMAMAEEKTGERDEGGDHEDGDDEGPSPPSRSIRNSSRGGSSTRRCCTTTPRSSPRTTRSTREGIAWRDDPDEIAAWKRGETGYPIVDAGMRQLREEAFMHNRVRMIVASFLTKDLLADWRHGYDYFRETLADHDTANDSGGWQWAASGTDAQPYFRIFNPMTQGSGTIPTPSTSRDTFPSFGGSTPTSSTSGTSCRPRSARERGANYPAPIVDHSERREEALAMYKRARAWRGSGRVGIAVVDVVDAGADHSPSIKNVRHCSTIRSVNSREIRPCGFATARCLIVPTTHGEQYEVLSGFCPVSHSSPTS